MFTYFLSGGIGDAILDGPAGRIVAMERKEKARVVTFDHKVKQVLAGQDWIEEIVDRTDLEDFRSYEQAHATHANDASIIMWNYFIKDNDDEMNYFYAPVPEALPAVRERRKLYCERLSKQLGKEIVNINPQNALGLSIYFSNEDYYYADWNRFGVDVSYEDVDIQVDQAAEKRIEESSCLFDPYVILHDSRLPKAGSNKPYVLKSWYEDRWCELDDWIRRKYGAQVIQMSSPGQPRFGRAMLHTDVIGHSACFQDYLALLKHCYMYIGTDSWPCHAAIFVRDPKFVVLKGHVSKRWDHQGRFSTIIREGGCQACEFAADGVVSEQKECLFSLEKHECMKKITVSRVEETIISLW